MTTLPLLKYSYTTQNHRVASFGIADEDDNTPRIYRTENVSSDSDWQEVIWAAYRQVFSEHAILESNRQQVLETQLKYRLITVKDFIRGLTKTETFYRLVVETNSNYRIVELVLKRVLGRAPYNEAEKITWSIVIAEEGISGFVDQLVASEEYETSFGDNTVPYQRKRFAERPFNLAAPRYGADYRESAGITKYDWQFTLQKYFTKREQERRLPEGDPRKFLDLVQQLQPKRSYPQAVRASDIPDYLAAVPRKR